MLEVPVYAFLNWGIYFFVEYIKTEKIYQLYLSIALLVLGLYIKTPIAFIAIPLLFVLLRKRGLDVFKDKHTYIIAFLAIVGIIPLVYITLGLVIFRYHIFKHIFYLKMNIYFPNTLTYTILVVSVSIPSIPASITSPLTTGPIPDGVPE